MKRFSLPILVAFVLTAIAATAIVLAQQQPAAPQLGNGHGRSLSCMERESVCGRIRDVRQGPDGLLYVLTDEEQGALLRIEPER
jgi:glucose/arabinose dehydrogenase